MIFYGRFKRRREMSGKEHQAEAIELSFKKSLEEKCRRWRSSIKNKSVCEFFRSNIIIAICFFYEIAHTHCCCLRYHIHQLFPSFFMISENFFWWYVMQKFVIEGWTHRGGGGPSKAHSHREQRKLLMALGSIVCGGGRRRTATDPQPFTQSGPLKTSSLFRVRKAKEIATRLQMQWKVWESFFEN